jgi:hypothetical protein
MHRSNIVATTKKTDIPNPYQGLTREQVLEQMRQLATEETRSQVLMGLLYNYLVDSQLLKGTQYKSALDFICSNIQQLSKSSLLLYSSVARKFTQEVCSRYGVYRLSSLLTYTEVTKIELNTSEPGGTFILVPDEKGEVKPKLFSSCTVEELRSAVQHARNEVSNQPIPADQRELVDQFREAVVGRFPQGSPVRVQLRVHKGEPVVHFQYIPVTQVAKLTEALLDSLYPAQEEPEGVPQAS